MINAVDRLDRLNHRVGKLMALGFECYHEDFKVIHPKVPGVNFDFSATDEAHFIARALEITFNDGKKQGANEVREQFATLMRFEN